MTKIFRKESNSTLRAQELCKSYISGSLTVPIISNLSIDVYPGELTLISGPSGCGKSTLLSILSGLLKPESGQVIALDKNLSDFSIAEMEKFRLKHTGFIFQGFNLFPALTALEQIQLPLGYMGINDRESRELSFAALEEVGLTQRAYMRPAQLSGGEKQRVAVARAIAKGPALLFADEPTSALDADNGMRVAKILRHIAQTRGMTVLCVSHDPRLIKQADRIMHMEDGLIQQDILSTTNGLQEK